jgi:hypothetical protein
VNDGEYGKLSFLLYAEERLSGFESAQRSNPQRRDWTEFSEFYQELWQIRGGMAARQPMCTGPIVYQG